MKRILLVEDDPFLIEIYSTKLKEVGFLVDVAADGKTALQAMQEKAPDLLVLDIVLPNLDGWEILRTMQKDEKMRKIKVLVLSNLSQKEEVQKGLELGAVKYLIKAHHTPGEVVAEITNLLK